MTTRRLTVTVLALTALTQWGPGVSAQDPSLVIGGPGTAIVDGILSPGEWEGAGTFSFDANLPEFIGGSTTPATMHVMNDAVNLYVAFQIVGLLPGDWNPIFSFDEDNDGIRVDGDDLISWSYSQEFGVPGAADFFRMGINDVFDTAFGGTLDVLSAGSNDATFTYLEMSHPLDSADDAHDLNVSPGDVIGFGGALQLLLPTALCDFDVLGEVCRAFTDFGGGRINPTADLALVADAPGACRRAAADFRRDFVAACIAAGGSRSACNRAGTEMMLARIAACPAP
jgi:hypothetical protein